MSPSTGEISLFPLNTVLFPGGLLPLRIFEQRYMEMAKACLREEIPFGVCLIRDGHEVGAPAEPESIGCLARILEWDMQQLGLLLVTARGEQRFRIVERRVEANGLARAVVELLPAETDAALPGEFDACAGLLRRVVEERGAGLFAQPHRYDSASWVSARLSEILPVPLAAKQKLMELDDAVQRIEILHKFLVQHRLNGA
jgi:Lon protease-like protein